MRNLHVIVGGQFGSESKGRVTLEQVDRRLAWKPMFGPPGAVWSVRVGGPNAGHVVYDDKGNRFALRCIPVGAVRPSVLLAIAAGSEIDLAVLAEEVNLLESHGHKIRERLWIHPEATVLEQRHILAEQNSDLVARLGSTAKGIGAARAERIWRNAQRVIDQPYAFGRFGQIEAFELRVSDREDVVIEGTQGYGLGLHAGHYPQCTSGNARAIDFCAQANLIPWDARGFTVDMVIRPYPIRVAGNSGELHGETSWEKLGLEEERTTVTKKVRRVGTFDPGIVADAFAANGRSNTILHVAMVDQIASGLAGATGVEQIMALKPEEIEGLREFFNQVPHSHRIRSLGTSPSTSIPLYTHSEQDAFVALVGHDLSDGAYEA